MIMQVSCKSEKVQGSILPDKKKTQNSKFHSCPQSFASWPTVHIPGIERGLFTEYMLLIFPGYVYIYTSIYYTTIPQRGGE